MKSRSSVIFAVFLFLKVSSGLIVETEDGLMIGTTMTSRLGVEFQAFLGVPFAAPPVRFAAPQRVDPWNGILNASAYGPVCPQPIALPPGVASEDCLHLNIFFTGNSNGSKPVLFFIHGGGFIGGAGFMDGPEYLMDRDLVVVTSNYRLGAFGFLATGTEEVPGNMGMKDQAFALQWVHRNIERFGGDPNRITIGGMSAGSISATAHLVSPMSRDLFIGVYGVSGAIAGSRRLRTNNLDLAERLAIAVECPISNVTEMITCLRSIPFNNITTVNVAGFTECDTATWWPVIEPDFGQERFIADDPITLFRNGNFARVPAVLGRTADEFVDPVPRILNNEDGLRRLNENFDELAPWCFSFEQNTTRSKAFSRLLRNYLPYNTIDVRSFNLLSHLFGDSRIGYPVHNLVELISSYTDVFYYKFSYVGRFSLFYFPGEKPYGMHHGDDLQFMFFTSYIGDFIGSDDPEAFMVDRMTRIVEHFVHTGNPNYDLSEMNWPQYNATHEFFMDINHHMIEKNSMFPERYSMWDLMSN